MEETPAVSSLRSVLHGLLEGTARLLAGSTPLQLSTFTLAHHFWIVWDDGTEQRRGPDQLGEQTPTLALPNGQLSRREEEPDALLGRVQRSEFGHRCALEGSSPIVLDAPAAAVHDEAQHTGTLKEAVPPLLLLLAQLLWFLRQAVTIFWEKMAHIEDSRWLWGTREQGRKYYKQLKPLTCLFTSFHFILAWTVKDLLLVHMTCRQKYVTLEHKSNICSNSQQYIVWVKIIHFSFMPKIIRILRSCSMKYISYHKYIKT